MPYLREKQRREQLDSGGGADNGAELNYQFCRMADAYLHRFGLTYANINEVIGAIECAKLEITRRIIAPYEDSKIAENGDVFRQVVAGL